MCIHHNNISRAQNNKDVTPCLTLWSYVFVVLSPRYIIDTTNSMVTESEQRARNNIRPPIEIINAKEIGLFDNVWHRPVYHPYARDKIRTRVISVALVWENIPKNCIKNRKSSYYTVLIHFPALWRYSRWRPKWLPNYLNVKYDFKSKMAAKFLSNCPNVI